TQLFDEAWRTMREQWYDADHDWDELGRKYREVAMTRSTRHEFQEVVRMMLGELNGSHLGIWGGAESQAAPARETGRLGLGLEPAEDGWLVTDVVPEGPCDRESCRLRSGDLLLSVNGRSLADRPYVPTTHFAEHFEGTVGKRVVLGVLRATPDDTLQPEEQDREGRGESEDGGDPGEKETGTDAGPKTPLDADAGARREPNGKNGSDEGEGEATGEPRSERVVCRPISDRGLRNLNYERWTDRVRALVEERSHGRIGYLHVRGMSVPSLERFETELFARANGRDALIIDVRNNGGGWTADYLLAILSAPEHAYTVPRGGERGYPQGRRPLAAWTKPTAVLINERTFSNAEIFAHAVKTTGRGKLVGQRTFGGVISTGARRLLDGSVLRVPFRGWYVLGTDHDMDRGGAVPDILVEQPPQDPIDRQAEAAVKALLEELAF
ncbi:S41 family peptidase, partial [Planctomycetota bacterium]